MGNNDDLEKSESAGGAGDKNNGEITIRAGTDNRWAEIEMLYEWSSGGNLLTVTTRQYRAKDNGGRSGNIRLSLVSKGDTGLVELSDDDAVQDGEWHDLVKSLSVEADAKQVVVHFSYIYDTAGLPDAVITGDADLQYK